MWVRIPPSALKTFMIKQFKDLKIIPLGGLGEVGRNMMLLEYKKDVLIIDMGLGFPEEDMPGIDCIIPNINYLRLNRTIRDIPPLISYNHTPRIIKTTLMS